MRLNFSELGDGKPVIILHGLFGSGENWISIAKKMAPEYKIYLPDLRNHGASPRGSSMDYPAMVEDVIDLYLECGISTASFIGHSMGGKIAMLLALNRPDLVEKLVVVDMAPVPYNEHYHETIDALLELRIEEINTRNDADDALKKTIQNPKLRSFLLKNLRPAGENRYEWRMDIGLIKQYYPLITGWDSEWFSGNGSYRGSTLFVKGERSSYVDEAYNPSIFRYFPFAKILTIENAGHWVHGDKPDLFLQHVLSFLKESI